MFMNRLNCLTSVTHSQNEDILLISILFDTQEGYPSLIGKEFPFFENFFGFIGKGNIAWNHAGETGKGKGKRKKGRDT